MNVVRTSLGKNFNESVAVSFCDGMTGAVLQLSQRHVRAHPPASVFTRSAAGDAEVAQHRMIPHNVKVGLEDHRDWRGGRGLCGFHRQVFL
ncbi:hypothetical protein AZH45_03100 [Corynebacterium striatum]|nr:hypothetical protein AZH45_03100 [Corynebacterium striatum]